MEIKTNSKYLIGYLLEVVRVLVLLLFKRSVYIKTFLGGDQNHELVPFRIDDDKL